MEDKIASELWGWYSNYEFRPVMMICKLAKGLEFLSYPASKQSLIIDYCPACEAWSSYMLPINDFIEKFPYSISIELSQKLEVIWSVCNSLSESAFHCEDFEIFHNGEWNILRVQSNELW